jgi:hypothetical protein
MTCCAQGEKPCVARRSLLRARRVALCLANSALIAFGNGAAEIESGISAAAAGAGTLAENHMFTEI